MKPPFRDVLLLREELVHAVLHLRLRLRRTPVSTLDAKTCPTVRYLPPRSTELPAPGLAQQALVPRSCARNGPWTDRVLSSTGRSPLRTPQGSPPASTVRIVILQRFRPPRVAFGRPAPSVGSCSKRGGVEKEGFRCCSSSLALPCDAAYILRVQRRARHHLQPSGYET